MFSAFVFLYLLVATMFVGYIMKRTKAADEPLSVRTHPPRVAEIVELFPQVQDERKAA